MLTIKCAKCKTKLYKYHKIGKGKLLKSHKTRIKKIYNLKKEDRQYKCSCGNAVGTDEGEFIKMSNQAFTYTGTKES
ncbi:hypothetical protein PRVXH_000961 [Proteinivorax hydrogeniformans]|uniref:Uncharacterized protein n=1 Tax=Proteinivorax hydrogeniformans TaxID=1826727 RepID=A0AAU8HW69_9FIRM